MHVFHDLAIFCRIASGDDVVDRILPERLTFGRTVHDLATPRSTVKILMSTFIATIVLGTSVYGMDSETRRYAMSEDCGSDRSNDWAPGEINEPSLEDCGFRADAFSPFVGPPAPAPESQNGSEGCNDSANDQSDRMSGDEGVYWEETGCG